MEYHGIFRVDVKGASSKHLGYKVSLVAVIPKQGVVSPITGKSSMEVGYDDSDWEKHTA